ncbi:unnamed protein product [Cuscuta epithymum]|uniref:Replication protein A 70 kDa DNA-binding subunit B/D first OB fold domain-containing protein n=2 Tax=Cuscuta epithymum TaxID=186058 RepID=A0AAV0CYE7_9ASTE|nr:unnamed protein product [Cuscuta epithymum]
MMITRHLEFCSRSPGTMAPTKKYLKDVVPTLPKVTAFMVMVIRKWNEKFRSKNPTTKSVEMIFMDEKSATIQATIPIELIRKFEYVQEGLIYAIAHPDVKNNEGRYRVTGHPYRFEFTPFTKYLHREQTIGLSFPPSRFINF